MFMFQKYVFCLFIIFHRIYIHNFFLLQFHFVVANRWDSSMLDDRRVPTEFLSFCLVVSLRFNLTALMYLYYGLAGLKIRLCKPYYITTLQISQMVVGVAVCCSGGYYIAMGEGGGVSARRG